MSNIASALRGLTNVTLGTARPSGASAHVYTVPAGSDPDIILSAPDDLFVFPKAPGLLCKVVSSYEELAGYKAFLFTWGDVIVYVTAETLKDHNYAFPTPAGANQVNGTKPGPYYLDQAFNLGPGTRVYAWITDATHGYIATRPSVVNYGGISSAQHDPELFAKTQGYIGWYGKLLPIATIRDTVKAGIPALIADAPSKTRKFIVKAADDELRSIPEGDMFTMCYGVSMRNVGDGATATTPALVRSGWLGHDPLLKKIGNNPAGTGARYLSSAGVSHASPVVYGGSIDPDSQDELLTRMALATALVDGDDMKTAVGTRFLYPAEREMPSMKEIVEEQSTFHQVMVGLVNVAAKTKSSPRAFVHTTVGGVSSTIGSAGAIDLFDGYRQWENDPFFGKMACQIQNHYRRIYARAEDYAKNSR